MMDMIEQKARQHGKAEVELCVQFTNERAIEFYTIRGTTCPRNGNNLVMRKRLS